jgi:hypothetical protein
MSPSLEPAAAASGSEGLGGLGLLHTLRAQVEATNACTLPGVSIKYETFIPVMWKAVAQGFVQHEHAVFVAEGLRWGFRAGVQVDKHMGHRWFSNYPSAVAAREAVSRATMKRVQAGKTVCLGPWSTALGNLLRATFRSTFIFPMGAVGKPLEPTEMRPTSDHTRTGLNAHSDLSFLKHTLDTYQEIAWFLKQDYFMRVSDVDAAFPLLPLHPDLWPFFLFRFFTDNDAQSLSLFAHLCGDFGAAGMPGTFKIFFVDVVLGMARAVQVITLPLCVYVDDLGAIGADEAQVNAEMLALHTWAEAVCGVFFKALKDKLASRVQLMLGFWWDSTSLTRTLDERKLVLYVEMLANLAGRGSLSLRDMQVAAGRMQRAIMTLPPGAACLLVGLFTLMAGLKLPWHKRRTNKGVRDDFNWLNKLLSLNMGRGFYSYANFRRAPEVRSDASKSKGYAGGGWVSKCGRYSLFKYGSRAARQPIDFLEGDTVVDCVSKMGKYWTHCIVPFGIDNSSFQLSLRKSRSKAPRLNVLIREIFALQVRFQCILETFWLSSEDNVLADHLSRDREWEFLRDAVASGFWQEGMLPLKHVEAGGIRQLPDKRGVLNNEIFSSTPEEEKDEFEPIGTEVHSISTGATRSLLRLRGAGPTATFNSTVPYSRASLFAGLPQNREARLEQLLDNRLSDSSWRTIQAGFKRWQEVCKEEGWSTIIPTDDPERGGKLVTFVLCMVDQTELVFSSIEQYVWGVRTWVKLKHQADPVYGIMGWDDFMSSVKVLTWVPSEPRKATPLNVIEAILDALDPDRFEDVQFAFFMLTLLFTFSRSECPCPKVFNGRGEFNSDVHWTVGDFDIKIEALTRVVSVLFKVIKQDPRIERPEARAEGGDRVFMGEIKSSKWCPLAALLKLNAKHGVARDRNSPMFVDEFGRPYLYRVGLAEFKEWQRRVGVLEEDLTGLHGLRVSGYNALKAVMGEELAVAHGGWRSTAHRRYERFSMNKVVRITRAIAHAEEMEVEADDGPLLSTRAPHRGLQRGQRELPLLAPPLLPEGWEEAEPEAEGNIRGCYLGPQGQVVSSRSEAWEIHNKAMEHETETHPDEEQEATPREEVVPPPPNFTIGRSSLRTRPMPTA